MSALLETFVMAFQADASGALRAISDLSDQNDKLEDSAKASKEALERQLKAIEAQTSTINSSKSSLSSRRTEQDKAAAAEIETANAAIKSSKAMTSASKAVESSVTSIEAQVSAIQEQASSYDKASAEAALYRLAQQGATKADLDRAKAALEASGAMRKEEASVASLMGRLVGFAAASFSVGAIVAGAFGRAETIRAIEQTSDALGIAIEDVDAFGKAAEAMDGDAQGARDSLTDMSEAMGEALADKESGRAEAFKKLGINIADANGKAKDGLTGMLDLAKAVEGMSKSEAVFKIKELGITDNRTVEMVLKGRQELERMLKTQKEQGVVSKESAENARKLSEAMGALKGSLNNASNGFIDALIPALTKVIEWLGKGVNWMAENQDFVIGFFTAIAAVVIGVYGPAMASAAIATVAATWPIIAIGAAIAAAAAAFALIYDDIANFIEGNDSFIGQIAEKYPIVGKIIFWLLDAFKQLWNFLIIGAQQIGQAVSDGFAQIVSGIGYAIDFMVASYGKISEFAGSVADIFGQMVAAVSAAFGSIGDLVSSAVAGLFSAIDGVKEFSGAVVGQFRGMSDGIAEILNFVVGLVKNAMSFVSAGFDKIKSGISGVAEFFGISGSDGEEGSNASGSPQIDDAMSQARQHLSNAGSAPSNGVTSSAISNSTSRTSNEVNVGQLTVQTQATDAQGMASEARSELQSQLKDLEAQSATGVAR